MNFERFKFWRGEPETIDEAIRRGLKTEEYLFGEKFECPLCSFTHTGLPLEAFGEGVEHLKEEHDLEYEEKDEIHV